MTAATVDPANEAPPEAPEAPAPHELTPAQRKAAAEAEIVTKGRKKLSQRFVEAAEKKFATLSTKNNFWHRMMGLFFLPVAYRTGIKFRGKASQMAGTEDAPFECVVPFSRFNKNWYNAMAGAALLANSEVAGGMFIFKEAGGDYTVVCKHLEYTFRRPCLGPAIYRVVPREDVAALVATGDEFNITVDMTILQAVVKKDEKDKKVGTSVATFHVTPKSKYWDRKVKTKAREKGALKG